MSVLVPAPLVCLRGAARARVSFVFPLKIAGPNLSTPSTGSRGSDEFEPRASANSGPAGPAPAHLPPALPPPAKEKTKEGEEGRPAVRRPSGEEVVIIQQVGSACGLRMLGVCLFFSSFHASLSFVCVWLYECPYP